MIWRNKDESSLQSQAYQAIRKQIIYADLEPGRKISERHWRNILLSAGLPFAKHWFNYVSKNSCIRYLKVVRMFPKLILFLQKMLALSENSWKSKSWLNVVPNWTQTRIVLETILEEQEKQSK